MSRLIGHYSQNAGTSKCCGPSGVGGQSCVYVFIVVVRMYVDRIVRRLLHERVCYF